MKIDNEQKHEIGQTLFDIDEKWKEEWKDMPEFVQEKQTCYAQIIFRFSCEEDLKKFSDLIGQKLTKKTKSAWFPFRSHWGGIKKLWKDES